MIKIKSVVVGFIFLAVLSPLGRAANILKIGNGGEPNNLDPQKVIGLPEFHVVDSLFEGLVEKDPKNLKPLPAAAQSWRVSEDGLTYTFQLRKNAKWSNGQPVTAEDFVYAWKRLVDPKTGAQYAHFGFLIRNGKKLNENKLANPAEFGAVAKSPSTLVVTLEQPVPYFLSLLSHSAFRPVPKAVVEQFGEAWTKPEHLVTNGPFKLESWKLHDAIELTKNPTYWDVNKVQLDGVRFVPVEQMDTEERLFRDKQLHLTQSVPIEKIEFWEQENKGVLQKHAYLGSYFYNLNLTVPPLDKPEVRKALALAIDRTELVKKVLKGGQKPATSFTPRGVAGYRPPNLLPSRLQRVAEAKQLLAKAGFPNGKGFPKLELLYNTSEGHRKIAEALQYMWKKNLNIEITLHNEEWKVYLDTKKQKKYALCRESWIGDYNDPTTFLDFFRSDSKLNTTGWGDAKFDTLLAEATRETKPKAREKKLQQAETRLLEALPLVPVYHNSRVYLKDEKVLGWYPNIEDVHPLKFVSLKKEAAKMP